MSNKIIVYGLPKEHQSVLTAVLQEQYEIAVSDCVTDLITSNPICTIIDSTNMNVDALRVLFSYYMDVGDRLDETVVWLGNADLPELPSFVRCDDFLQLALNIKEIISKAQERYDIMAQYTDMYSYLPKHAIAECVEADAMAAYQKLYKIHPGFYSPDEFRAEWQKVQRTENGAELLAAVSEFSRWLKRKGISYRVLSEPFGMLNWVMDITDESYFVEDSDVYQFLVTPDNLSAINKWLENHWYFRNPDPRFQVCTFGGLETGLTELDLQIRDIQPGEVILVGGRPAMGKTSLAKGIAEHVAKTKNVLFFDLEECGSVRNPNIHGLTGRFDIEQIYTAMEKEKPDLLIIDRLQRIPEIMDDGNYQTIMGALKRWAQNFKIPILITTDLSRDIEERSYPVPGEKDIPAYSVISQFVDMVLLLYRPAYYDPELDRSLARIYIPKAKRISHPYRTVLLHWDDEKYRFTD